MNVLSTLISIIFVACFLVRVRAYNKPRRSIYNKLTQEGDYESFAELIRRNREAQKDLLQNELTLFIPTNSAFQEFTKPLHSDTAFYHMATGLTILDDLKSTRGLSSVKHNFPKLWITKTDDDRLFVNNAEILLDRSDYIESTRHPPDGKQQVLHVIDKVLDPYVRLPKTTLTAYDFMLSIWKWNLDIKDGVSNFLHKVNENGLAHLYQLGGANTYLIPIDRSIDTYKFKMLNRNTIFGHIIPDFVLFSRPTRKNFNYETMANDDNTYIVISMDGTETDLYVYSSTIAGNEDNPKGTFRANIIKANIPVYNGVVHLISEPLGIYNRTNPFPFLPIMAKLAADPTLDTFFELGERTGFNKIFTTHNVSFTYFIPNNHALLQMKKKGLTYSENDVELLKKHLVISDVPYSMERLLALSKNSNTSGIRLKTIGGLVKLTVLEIDDTYYIKYNQAYIKVVRPNYECTDGIIHILAAPLTNLH
ncbi:fasciclin-1-like [Sitophilus oryzae]|uniref:Fasciclin-1-like n=1 Tax=Sitophilus oryzae TaxID=7048 RepID=A0A6J2XVX6_SITOR|nr:fasciclin-1-like [Sitophilus oryzae]